ncbi:peptidase U32 family protein [Geomesophilobacter sediminis]|uniref:U32 family peptidase n=1 Tax=Geomesophilobacter sediminis TaxID=2798584 RepID=A0A8J7IRD0_9BACT|nr:U32 family peptidase [Geomesophilobacter sediminis]MBJ6725434.1 U32 family peptidase [Geomesophilobacter sediminis]
MSKSISTPKKPELLSPAGSLEAFFAAMEKGADAVYAGLKDFSARAKAKNFSLSQMERMTTYAHSMGRKIYVTLNTLVKEAELPQLVETLAALEVMRVDGVILQDLAVARLARLHFPGIPLHASTQMTIHNSLGVKQLEELGFERVVLARELHLNEIKSIIDTCDAEIECFIHGALCFSFSGQCFFSSFLGGHSGNRGRCAQPCRRQYKYKGKEGYYLSTNDFSSIEMIPHLAQAGVASLKIEGRMKSAEYVASVIGAYRMVLDAPEGGHDAAVAQAKELLKLSFGRVPTKGFLASHTPTDISTPSIKGATGRYLGDIRAIRGGRISFETRDRLHVGDRIRVQPKTDMAGRAFTIKELFIFDKPVKNVKENTLVSTPSPFPFKLGDSVFKVSSETAFTMSENACLKRLDAVKGDCIPCELAISHAGESMRIAARVAGQEFVKEFPLGPLEPARSSDMESVLRGQFSKCGDTSFNLRSLSAPDFPALLIPGPLLKEVRRGFYAWLAEQVVGALKKQSRLGREQALASLVPSRPAPARGKEELLVQVEQAKDWFELHRDMVDSVVLPVSKANMHQVRELARKVKGKEDHIIWQLPFIIFEADLPFYREAVTQILGAGFKRFELTNLSQFQLFKGTDAELSTGYRLFSLNSQALLSWQELGAVRSTLYIEDDRENLARVLAADVRIKKSVVLYAPIPVITSKIGIKELKGDVPITSDRGEAYTVKVKDHLTVVSAKTPFALTQYRSELRQAGCGSFTLDLSLLQQQEERDQVLEAYRKGVAVPGASEFNYSAELV